MTTTDQRLAALRAVADGLGMPDGLELYPNGIAITTTRSDYLYHPDSGYFYIPLSAFAACAMAGMAKRGWLPSRFEHPDRLRFSKHRVDCTEPVNYDPTDPTSWAWAVILCCAEALGHGSVEAWKGNEMLTKQQADELLSVLQEGSDVQVVTFALQIAATNAKQGNQADAVAIRRLVDQQSSEKTYEEAYKRKRLGLAMQFCAMYGGESPIGSGFEYWLELAERVIAVAATRPVPALESESES